MPLLESSVLAEIYVEEVGLENLLLGSTSSWADHSIPESLTKLILQDCPDLLIVGDKACLPSSLLHLQITACPKIEEILFRGDSPLLRTVHMNRISLLEPNFKRLESLEELVIEDAELISLEKFPSTLLSTLKKLCLISCKEFVALPEDMKQFPSLKSLRLKKCHKISSLPYLPYNLDELRVDDCPLLEKRYREDSAGWSMISHVPYKYI